jgi:hypothetical protein
VNDLLHFFNFCAQARKREKGSAGLCARGCKNRKNTINHSLSPYFFLTDKEVNDLLHFFNFCAQARKRGGGSTGFCARGRKNEKNTINLSLSFSLFFLFAIFSLLATIRYFLNFLPLVTAAGTAAKVTTVCLLCPKSATSGPKSGPLVAPSLAQPRLASQRKAKPCLASFGNF